MVTYGNLAWPDRVFLLRLVGLDDRQRVLLSSNDTSSPVSGDISWRPNTSDGPRPVP